MGPNIIMRIENKIEEFKIIKDRMPTKLYLPRDCQDDIFILWSEKGNLPGLSAVHGFREEIIKNYDNKFKGLEIIWGADELKVE